MNRRFESSSIVAVLAAICLLAPFSEAVLSQELMLSVRPILRECAAANNVTDAQLKAIIANDLSNNSANIQCLALCFFKRLGIFNEDGLIILDTTKALFAKGENAEFVNEVVDQCKELRGANPCETASLTYACFVHKKLL